MVNELEVRSPQVRALLGVSVDICMLAGTAKLYCFVFVLPLLFLFPFVLFLHLFFDAGGGGVPPHTLDTVCKSN